jgi:hypothetical protein
LELAHRWAGQNDRLKEVVEDHEQQAEAGQPRKEPYERLDGRVERGESGYETCFG